MNAARHSHVNTTMIYLVENLLKREEAIRKHQERIMGKPEGGFNRVVDPVGLEPTASSV